MIYILDFLKGVIVRGILEELKQRENVELKIGRKTA